MPPDLVAEFGDHELLVVEMLDGNPRVFFGGQVKWATDVTIRGQRLSGLRRAPYAIPAPAGLWADFDWTPEGGETVRQSLPVMALRIEGEGRWAFGMILGADGIEVCAEDQHGNFKFLGYRLGEPGPFCSYEADRPASVAAGTPECESTCGCAPPLGCDSTDPEI